jgi:hypothetical protein
MSLRKACDQADIDNKSYKRNLPLLENLEKESSTKQEIPMISKTKEPLENVNPTPVSAPVQIKEILIRLPIDDYNYLVEEKKKTGVTPSTNAAKYVREKIRENKRKESLAMHINT